MKISVAFIIYIVHDKMRTPTDCSFLFVMGGEQDWNFQRRCVLKRYLFSWKVTFSARKVGVSARKADFLTERCLFSAHKSIILLGNWPQEWRRNSNLYHINYVLPKGLGLKFTRCCVFSLFGKLRFNYQYFHSLVFTIFSLCGQSKFSVFYFRHV